MESMGESVFEMAGRLKPIIYTLMDKNIEFMEYFLENLEINDLPAPDLAIINNMYKIASFLVLSGKFDVNKKNSRNKTLIQQAVHLGNFELANHLLEFPEVDLCIEQSDSVIFLTCLRGNLSFLIKILDDPRTTKYRDYILDNLFFIACHTNNSNIIRYACEYPGVNINHCNYRLVTGFLFCCRYRNIEIIRYLLHDSHIDPSYSDVDGNTCLHGLFDYYIDLDNENAVQERLECLRILISDFRIDINAKNKSGNSVLIPAIKADCELCVREIVSNIHFNPELNNNEIIKALSDPKTSNKIRDILSYYSTTGE